MSAVEDRDRLEARLDALRAGNPVMPPGLERRIRARLVAEARRPVRTRRTPPRPPSAGGMAGQFLALVVLLTLAGWVVTTTVVPVLRGNWEKNHCAPGQASAAVPASGAAAASAAARPPLPAGLLVKDHCAIKEGLPVR